MKNYNLTFIFSTKPKRMPTHNIHINKCMLSYLCMVAEVFFIETSLLFSVYHKNHNKFVRSHPHTTYAKFTGKLTFLIP